MSNYFAFKATAAAGSGGYFSTGTIIPWTTATQADLPGFLICNGTAVSRSTYADLFAVIGTTYGTGDGSSTFTLPNFQQKTMIGQDGNTNYAIGDTGGNTTSTPNIVFGSANKSVTVDTSSFGISVADANVTLPSHSHFIAASIDNLSAPSGSSLTDVISANTQAARTTGNSQGGTDFKYRLVGTNTSATVGKTSTEGSGNGSHNHNASFNGSVSASFNQSNLSANANAASIVQPYTTVTFMIKT
tara:strand:+ start:346 stop:1080 length:735 start_codon:yes stop_codon:yes gene_type:complete